MYTARVGGYELPVMSGSAEWKQNEIGKFDFYVPYFMLGNANLYLESVEIYREGTLILQGLVLDYTKTKMQGKSLLVELNCLEMMGELMLNYYGKASAHYQDAALTVIMADLLSSTGSAWQLGSFSTMPDTLIKTTVDAREKETLWAQLVEAVKKTPGNALRYGGQNIGVKYIDIGQFSDPIGVIYEDILLAPLKFKRRANMPIKTLRAFGGKAGGRLLTLQDALNANPSLATDPNFPVTIDAQGQYVVTNAALAKGRNLSKSFDSVKTKNDSAPTIFEINAAGTALYQAAVRELQKNQPYLTVEATCAMEIPPVPSTWRIVGNAYESVWDGAEGHVRNVPTFDLDHQMTLISARLDFDESGIYQDQTSQELIVYETLKLEFTDNAYLVEEDEAMVLSEKTETYDKQDFAGNLTSFSASASVVVTQSSVASNCTHSSGAAGRQFTFTMPTPPAGAKGVYVSISADASCGIDIVTQPKLSPLTNAVACVTGAGGAAWTVASNITCTAIYYFVL